jgi:hypothetical protein
MRIGRLGLAVLIFALDLFQYANHPEKWVTQKINKKFLKK